MIKLNNGGAWNPYLKYPRNESCYCRSGKKFKKCCLKTEALAIDSHQAKVAAAFIKTLKNK